jgi:pyridoxal phosphate enzyme (YggS family)
VPEDASGAPARREEVAAGLAAVRERVAAACRDAGRDPDGVSLVVVTKTFPASDVAHLAALGVTDVAENRDQEAAGKVAECARLGLAGLRWHFVGQLQRNKARSVAGYADVVHSVDRPRLVPALDRAAADADRRVRCLVQVDLEDGADAGRGGARPEEVPALAGAVASAGALELAGVMAVAPRDGDPDAAFARLARLASALRSEHPEAVAVSAGMSGDLEAALRHGATHLRVGTAILGSRPPLG